MMSVKHCGNCKYYDLMDIEEPCCDCIGEPPSKWKPNEPAETEPTIKDSGERREFESGAVWDMQTGKGRCDLMPLEMVERFMCCMEKKAGVLYSIEQFRLTGNILYIPSAMEKFCTERGWSKSEAMMELSKHFEAGAEKYGVDNWRKGLPEWSYMSSAVRHYIKWVDGWTDEPHDRAVLWNLICLWWTHENIQTGTESEE